MEETKQKTITKKRLTPESTVLLTIAGTALAIVVYRVIRLIITGS